jgi:hypothetical protein
MRLPSARDRVVELLRTLDDAREDRSWGGSGGGVIQMSVLYKHGSYQELEERLWEMRDNGLRRLWWNLCARYRWGSVIRQPLPSIKTRQGRKPVLPPRSELRITGETLGTSVGGPVLMVVQYYQWPDSVEPRYVDAGIDHLLQSMHGGDTSKITLPKEFMERLMSDVEPRAMHLPSPSLLTA